MLYPLSYERKVNRPEPVPAELLRGTPLMAVGAPDETLVDLGLDSTPRNSAPEQNRDFRGLQRRIGVVELQDDRILLPAVDARVIGEVVADLASKMLCLSNSSHVSRRDLLLAVSVIPILRVCPLTEEADPLARLPNDGPKWKFH